MNIEFLPSPLYILICLCAFVAMIFLVIKRRKQDRKALIAAYIIIACAPLFMIIGRVMPEYYGITARLNFGIYIILFMEFTVIGICDFKKGKIIKKRTVIGLLLAFTVIIFFSLIFLRIIS